MSDIITARYVIFAFGFLLALLCSFFYSHLLRYETIGQVIVAIVIAVAIMMMMVMTIIVLAMETVRLAKNQKPETRRDE
jgi:RsiW-degrading membrane proteinase PrsW (M82 family)